MDLENGEVPFVSPFDFEAIFCEVDGEPYMSSVDGVGGAPDVEHGYEGVFFPLNREDVGALSAEGLFRAYLIVWVDAFAWVSEFFPGAPYGVGYGGAGFVWCPACAA